MRQLSLTGMTDKLPFNAERLIKTSRSEPLKIKIPGKNMRKKPTNTPIIHSVY
jgi:hypothetical protein